MKLDIYTSAKQIENETNVSSTTKSDDMDASSNSDTSNMKILRQSLRSSARASIGPNLRIDLKANKNKKIKLNKTMIENQVTKDLTIADEETMLKLAKISKNRASLAITTLKVPPKPAMVTIENINKDSEIIEIVKNIKSEPMETSDVTLKKDTLRTGAVASKLLERAIFKNLTKSQNLIKPIKTRELNDKQSCQNNQVSKDEILNRNHSRELFFKINYLNACGILGDSEYDFLTCSLPKYTPKQSVNENDKLNFKQSIDKTIADNIDNKISLQVVSSPFYSLTLQLDSDNMAIFVYIQYIQYHSKLSNKLDDQTRLQTRRLVKLLNYKQFNQMTATSQHLSTQPNLIPAKLSKHLIEQIRNNVINHFNLGNKNLMCISIDSHILERLCFPTFQFYLSEFVHDCILIVPSSLVAKSMRCFLTDFESDCLVEYFQTTNNLIDYFKSFKKLDSNGKSVENVCSLNDFGNLANLSECLLDKNLPSTILILQTIYFNYSSILEKLESSNRKDFKNLDALFNAVNTIDYYFITCLLYDLSQFLFDYMLYPKRFSSTYTKAQIPWNLKGSILNNLLNEQIGLNNESIHNESMTCDITNKDTEASIANNSNVTLDTKKCATISNISLNDKKSTIEFETSQLDHLTKLKQYIESKILNYLDFNSENSSNKEKYSFLTKSKPDEDDNSNDDSCISMLEIYSSLCQMFDVNYSKIQKTISPSLKFSKYQVSLSLETSQIQNILYYYKFHLYTDIDQIKSEYQRFFDHFFKLNYSNTELQEADNKVDSLYELTLMSDNEIKLNLIKFVYDCNSTKFCPIISTLASIYFTLPSIIDFKEIAKFTSNNTKNIAANKGTNLNAQELTFFENKTKFLDLYISNAHTFKDFLIKFEDF